MESCCAGIGESTVQQLLPVRSIYPTNLEDCLSHSAEVINFFAAGLHKIDIT